MEDKFEFEELLPSKGRAVSRINLHQITALEKINEEAYPLRSNIHIN
jgi:hypothetical protein